MTKTRELLACSMLALAVGAMPVLAEPAIKLAQQQTPETDKSKQPGKGQPAKGQQPGQPPGGQPPAAKGPPPAAKPQPTTATPSQPQQRQAPQPSQPAARTQPPQTPTATQTQPGQPRPVERERRPATAQQPGQSPGQPGTTQGQPGQPRPGQPGKPPGTPQPAQSQQPAQTTQPSTTQTPPGQRPVGRDQRQPTVTQQPGQVPAVQGQPGQRRPGEPLPSQQAKPPTTPAPAPTTTQQQQPAPQQQAQPPATQAPASQGQPPAAAQQPSWQQQPAARTQPPGAPPPTQPAVTQQPGQEKFQPGQAGQAPRHAIAPQPMGAQGQPLRRVDDLRGERREVREGDRVVIREPDRVIIREGGRTIIRHNEVDRFRWGGGREVAVDRRGNEVMSIIERPDGTRIITVVDEQGRLIRRARRTRDGREIIIIDNRIVARPGVRAGYFVELPPPVIRIPRERYIVEAEYASREDIYAALIAPPVERIDRRYSLEEVRQSPTLRDRMPRVDLDTITFDTGSWELGPEQIELLAVIAEGINQALAANPSEVFLIEGHTDAVGPDDDNLSLSDRRAEAVALALTEQFQVPAENLTTQGYGEQYLKIPTDGPERRNRRVSARRITPLLNGQTSTGQAN